MRIILTITIVVMHKEIDEYLNFKRANKDKDILEWW